MLMTQADGLSGRRVYVGEGFIMAHFCIHSLIRMIQPVPISDHVRRV